MVNIDFRNPRAIYEQVKDNYRRQIVAGVLSPGDRMPSVRELAGQLAINPNTIQRAYRELEQEGYLYSVPGKGSFVSDRREASDVHREELLSKLDSVLEELFYLGMDIPELLTRAESIRKKEGGER